MLARVAAIRQSAYTYGRRRHKRFAFRAPASPPTITTDTAERAEISLVSLKIGVVLLFWQIETIYANSVVLSRDNNGNKRRLVVAMEIVVVSAAAAAFVSNMFSVRFSPFG